MPGRGKTDGFEFFCQLSILPCSVVTQFGTGAEEGSCFLTNVSYNESYGYRLAQSSRGINRPVSASTVENRLCRRD